MPLHTSSTTGHGYVLAPAANSTAYQPLPAQPHAQPGTADRTPIGLQQLLKGQESRDLARVRGPMVFAAQRIGLTSRRCGQLESSIAELRQRLNNAGSLSESSGQWTEQRLFDLEKALHDERLVLWRDLLPLAENARDAAVDAMRSSWLNELARVLGGGERQ